MLQTFGMNYNSLVPLFFRVSMTQELVDLTCKLIGANFFVAYNMVLLIFNFKLLTQSGLVFLY
jgi:hypothetical protein